MRVRLKENKNHPSLESDKDYLVFIIYSTKENPSEDYGLQPVDSISLPLAREKFQADWFDIIWSDDSTQWRSDTHYEPFDVSGDFPTSTRFYRKLPPELYDLLFQHRSNIIMMIGDARFREIIRGYQQKLG